MTEPTLSVSCRAGELELRELQPADVSPDYVDWMNDPEVARYTEQKHQRHSMAGVVRFVEEKLKSEADYLFGIFHDGTHIGNIKLGPINEHHQHADISYIIGRKEYWSKGVASAVVKAVADFGLKELGLGKICAGCFVDNAASLKVLERAGFVVEGRLAGQLLLDGKRTDQILLGRLADSG